MLAGYIAENIRDWAWMIEELRGSQTAPQMASRVMLQMVQKPSPNSHRPLTVSRPFGYPLRATKVAATALEADASLVDPC